jgi:glycosyltransferase involved in cell wall biosynthesis
MIEGISKHLRSSQSHYQFCILIPSWNNLSYLKLCINSIIKNSSFNFQIIVIVNEGKDGTLDWVSNADNIDYVYSPSNIGICYALNITRSLIKSDYIIYVNDDMYMLPGWDLVLHEEIKLIQHNSFMLSSTMIEPNDTRNPCVVTKNYGQNIEEFNEAELLRDFNNLKTTDWHGSTWPPLVMHIDLWDFVGGMSIEFSPGMYSDPDLSKKLYEAGVRIFKGMGKSLVYHFGSKSTKRIKENKGKKIFMLKWGISSRSFTTKYLHRGEPYSIEFQEPVSNWKDNLLNKIKRIKNC